jgi:hypothetical protein
MVEETSIRRFAKPLRRDVRERLRAVVERARLLAFVDPKFQDQLNLLGISQEVMATLEVPSAEDKGRRSADRMPAAKSGSQPAPFKSLRRQLRNDVSVLLDEIRLLGQLDPSSLRDFEQYHLTEIVQKLEKARASTQD